MRSRMHCAQIVVAVLAFGLAPDLSCAQQDSFTPDRRPPFTGDAGGGGWRGGARFGLAVPGMFAPAVGSGLMTLPRASAAEGGGEERHPPPRHRRPKPETPRPKVIVERPQPNANVEGPPPRWWTMRPPPPPATGPVAAPSTAAQMRAKTPPAPKPPAPALPRNVFPPPPGETRFRRDEILVSTAPDLTPAALANILGRHRLTEVEAAPLTLTGSSLRLWRIPDGRAVAAVVNELAGEPQLTSVQPNYLYALEDDAPSPAPPALDEYWLAKLEVGPALDLDAGDPVRVALIDTAIDEMHPDLVGAIEDRFDAIQPKPGRRPHAFSHGTAIAGAIAARGRLKGVAPTVRILSARAFDSDETGAELGTTFSITKSIDWAANSRARIINMSFAGPRDPALHALLAAAAAKGMTLVGAAGNAGPKSPPLYPAADENVVAVSATDADDAVYPMANAGPYIAVAAPGVDVLLPAPNGGYAMETGTSVSAALVSGIAALMIERRPEASPSELKAWLEKTARPIGGADKDRVGAGMVDARLAIEAVAERGEPPQPHPTPGF